MQTEISAGNDWLRFPQVTGGNLHALAGVLAAVCIVPFRADFFQTSGRFLLSRLEQFDQCNLLLPLKYRIKPSELSLVIKM